MNSLDWNRLAIACVISVGLFACGWQLGNIFVPTYIPIKPAFPIATNSQNKSQSSHTNTHKEEKSTFETKQNFDTSKVLSSSTSNTNTQNFLKQQDKNTQSVANSDLINEGQKFAEVTCAVCHSFKPNGPTLIGPNLYNIVDQPIASKKNYIYSKALSAKIGIWSKDNLDQYIENPTQWAPGNKMIYQGVSSTHTREAIIAYLRSLSP